MAIAQQALGEILEGQVNRTGSRMVWQFRLLVAGAAFYIAWHVLQMYLRTPDWPWRLCYRSC